MKSITTNKGTKERRSEGTNFQFSIFKCMPIKKENRDLYPANWREISRDIRFNRADGCCEFCGAVNYTEHPTTGSIVVLTVAHLDHNPANCDYDNLKALCEKCHNAYDREHRYHSRRHTMNERKYKFNLKLDL